MKKSMLHHGQVSERNVKNASARVAMDDFDGMVSGSMQVLFPAIGGWNMFYTPKEGDHVVMSRLPNGQQEGHILGKVYTASKMPQNGAVDIILLVSDDGKNVIRLDGVNGTMDIICDQGCSLKAKNIDIEVAENATIDVGKNLAIDTGENLTIDAGDNITANAGANVDIHADDNIMVDTNAGVAINAEADVAIAAAASVAIEAGNDVLIEAGNHVTVEAVNDAKFGSSTTGLVELGNSVDTVGGLLLEMCRIMRTKKTTGSPALHTTSPDTTAEILAFENIIRRVLK